MLPFPSRLSLLVAAGSLAIAACSNISLSSGNGSLATSGGKPPGSTDVDAAGAGDSSDNPGVAIDAGVAPSITGNALCNYSLATANAHYCVPDTQCVASPADAAADEAPVAPADAGAVLGAGDEADAGTVAVDAGVIDAGPAPTACHVVQESESDGGEWKSQTCEIAGSGTDGAQCTKSTDCAATFECVGSPGQCRRYCCGGESVCGATYAPSFCDIQPVASDKFVVPVCMPISGCALFGKCNAGETCAIVKDDGTTSCVQIGSAKAGDPCDAVHCDDGLTCLGNAGARTCFQLCHVDAPTECAAGTTCTGSAQVFSDPQVGICQ